MTLPKMPPFGLVIGQFSMPQRMADHPGEVYMLKSDYNELQRVAESYLAALTERDALRSECAELRVHADNLVKLTVDHSYVVAERDALRADAERYRWLRHGDNDDEVIRYAWDVDDESAFLLRNEQLDAAIDAAMQEEPPK